MKKTIFISLLILLVSCTKKEYKVNFTFSHFDTQTKKTYKSEPVDLYVVVKDSTELESAISDTLSNAYCFAAQDIVINNFEISENNHRNTETLYLSLTDDDTYDFLKRFTKTYVLKGNFTKRYTNYSPNMIDSKKIDAAYLTVNNRNVRLVDSFGNTLFTCDIIPLNNMKKLMNGTSALQNSNNNMLPFFLKSKQYIEPNYKNQKNFLVNNFLLYFLGNNNNYNDIKISLCFENNYGLSNELFVNEVTINYSKNEIYYNWFLNFE